MKLQKYYQLNTLKVSNIKALIMHNGPFNLFILYCFIFTDALMVKQRLNVAVGRGAILTTFYTVG